MRFLDALQAIGHACTRCPPPQDVVEAVVHLGANSLTGELALDPEFVRQKEGASDHAAVPKKCDRAEVTHRADRSGGADEADYE